MQIDPTTLDSHSLYLLLVGGITPRPIAWVSTISDEGVDNIAPFAFFTVASSNPPVLCFTQINPRTGKDKDTLNNLLATKECVVHIANTALAEQLNLTCAELPSEQSEFEFANIDSCPSQRVKPLSVVKAPVRYECTLREVIEVSSQPAGGKMILVDVISIYVNDDLYHEGKINQTQLDSIGKMGGNFYNHTKDLFELTRPKL